LAARLELDRQQILAYRRRANGLDERLPRGSRSLRRIAWAGLQDSMPRAALLSIHARMQGADPNAWEHPSLLQVWGPRFSAYVVSERDLAVFTLGRMPEEEAAVARTRGIAALLQTVLGDARMRCDDAARALRIGHANRLRYAAPTGTVVMRWDGARQPVIWNVPPPDTDPQQAHLELARRYLHVFGPATAEDFAQWAGIRPRRALRTFEALRKSLTPVFTPIGEAWIASSDEPAFRAAPTAAAPARLLPSGDAYFLLQGRQRELLVDDARHRSALWTSRVWPGALLVDGAVVGTWRRAEHLLTIQPWCRLSPTQRAAVEAEAASLPLPGIERKIAVRWDGAQA
jgi:hypothetical protein